MNAWSTDGGGGDIMGATVTEATSGKVISPPLKNGSDLRESGYLIAVGSRTARFRRKHRNTLAMFILLGLLLFLLILAITMTVLYVKLKRHKPLRVCESKECLRSAANLAMSMDRAADPCDDFYQYVCGNWAEDHPRPDAYRSYDWFRDKQTKVYTLVRDFLAKNSSSQPRPVMQARDMYAACMDSETLDKRGLKPVTETLEALGLPPYPTFINITEDFDYSSYNFDWLEAVIKIKVHLGMDVLIGFDIFSDPKNSSTYRLVMGSPETTNPFPSMFNENKRHKHNSRRRKRPYSLMSRHNKELILNEEYFEIKESDDDDEEENRKQISRLFYAELMKQFVVESGASKTTALSETELDQNILLATSDYVQLYTALYELETDNSTQSDEEYNGKIPEYTIEEIQAHTDSVVENNNGTATPIWKRYLEGVFSISDVVLDFENDKILISDMDLRYMSLMAALMASTPPVSIELFVWMKVIEVMAVHTTTELRVLFANSYDELRGRRPGDSGAPPRSLSCASAVNDMMGMAVSYAIANPHFLNVTKPKITTMLHEMKNALARLVGKVKWMDFNTKLATFEKIVQMKSLVGFPDWLLEEGRLEDFYQGIEVDVETHLENMISVIRHKLKSVLNRFRESNNFTWATDPTEVNAYHTFQENTIRRQFDKRGNLVPWWSNETVESFVNLTHCFIDQYSSFYVPELDEHVDGKRTLGENIADNGGVKEALGALTEHLHKTGPEQKLPGFENMSSEQMFFLSYGNLWCGVSTKESLKAELEDEHSPQEFRARGSLQNNEDFARAWRCPPGSAMNPRHRCVIF